MTTQEREVMQMALDALEHGMPIIEDYGGKEQLQIQHKAITALYEALRAALEQPTFALNGIDCSCGRKWRVENGVITASEPETFMAKYKFQTYGAYKADGEMKIGVMPEQEPQHKLICPTCKADRTKVDCQGNRMNCGLKFEAFGVQPKQAPKREWQGLTEQDTLQIRAEWEVRDYRLSELCRAIEAKLRGKNGG